MIEDALVIFNDGDFVDADRVKFVNSSWVGVNGGDGWVYYSNDNIKKIDCREGMEY